MKTPRSRRGLSLIEIIVVITIISMLMSAVGVYALGQYKESQRNLAKLDVRNASIALDLYRASQGRYPDPADGFVPLLKAHALKELPKDPWGNALVWKLVGGDPVVTSLGADGAPGGVDDAADVSTAEAP
jgi:general secretion pathway protein G